MSAYQLVDPDSKLEFSNDWSDWAPLQGSPSDTIASREWSITPLNGTSPETPTLTNETTGKVIVEEMQAGKIYWLTEGVTTAAGLKDDKTIVLRCDQR